MIETGIISKVKIQDVISNQLPNFILDESPETVDFLKQYYTSQEYQGGPSDISDNLEQYLNVNNLTPEVIVDSSTTVGLTTIGAKTIHVTSTKGFPNHYGLFGGAIEKGENSKTALRRELREEIGLNFF